MQKEIGKTRSGLRFGYTTGSCAAAAAKAAARMLFSGEEIRSVELMTPKGIRLFLDVEQITRTPEYVKCAVRKFSGDDPDVTDGLLIFAQVERCGTQRRNECEPEERILLDGGDGVGRVTRPGLEQDVGQPAINRIPRQMIREGVLEMCDTYHFSGCMKVTISIPKGKETAVRTFNPRLGIVGGLSILGTSGIVEPMSEKALTDTIYLEMKMLRESGCRVCCVIPGNYGGDFLRDTLQLDPDCAVKCSNYVGEAVDDGVLLGMKGLLLIGHIGKFVKLAAGVMNTHSRQADCRMEVLAAHAAMAGADRDTVCNLMKCINTTEALGILERADILKTVMQSVTERASFYIRNRAAGGTETELILFSQEYGILGETKGARNMLRQIRESRVGQKSEKKEQQEERNR